MHPFISGQEYKRDQLMAFLGSRQFQSGVLWGSLEPGCLICTSGGRHGRKAGYTDEELSDGRWWYFGQGATGDQDLTNAANSKLAAGDRSVLLFSSREPNSREIAQSGSYGKIFKFSGSFNVAGHEVVVPKSGSRKGDRLIRFTLVIAEDLGAAPAYTSEALPIPSLASLRAKIVDFTQKGLPMIGAVEYRKRSALVHAYARARACGMCEGCAQPAPFLSPDGQHYLEVHHIQRLADDGPDAPENVAAVCPNCHRRAHYSSDRAQFNAQLRAQVASAERDVPNTDVAGNAKQEIQQ